MKWEFDPKRPIYLQIVERLKLDLLSGVYPTSTPFPTVRDLAVEAGVNPNTMSKALQLLESEGFLITHRTKGRMVTDDFGQISNKKEDATKEILNKFLEDMKKLGYSREDCVALLKEETEW